MILNFCLLGIVIIIYLFSYTTKKFNVKTKKNVFFFLVFLLFFVIVGFRDFSIGTDTQSYIAFFKNVCIYRWQIFNISRFEYGYVILNVIISLFTQNPRIFLIIFSFIVNFFMLQFIYKNSKIPLLSVIMLLGLLFFYNSMTMFRQYIALCLVLYSTKYIKEKKKFLFLLFIIIASSFHISAIVSVILYPISNMKFNIKKCLLFIVFTIIAIYIVNSRLSSILTLFNRDGFYIDTTSYNISNILYTIVYLAMFIIANKLSINDTDRNDSYLFILLISISINFIAIGINSLSRLSLYFNIFSIVIFPNILYKYVNFYNRTFWYILIFTFLIAYSTTILYYRPQWHQINNYFFGFNSVYKGFNGGII